MRIQKRRLASKEGQVPQGKRRAIFHEPKAMAEVGDLIASHILGATTAGDVLPDAWAIEAGTQWVLVQLEAREVEVASFNFPHDTSESIEEVVAIPEVGLSLYHYRPALDPYAPHAYVILRREVSKDHDALARLRDYTVRMHVEHESLLSLLRHVEDKSPIAEDGTFVKFIESKISHLSRKRRFGFEQDELLHRLLSSDAPFSPEQRRELRARLKDIKTNISPKLDRILEKAGDSPPPTLDASEYARSEKMTSTDREIPTKIFIGHGHSGDWRELKDFLRDRLFLEHEEYNRVPQAGISTSERLSQMLDGSDFAFVIMTAEDETTEGKVQARQSVVHEVGLFQGRLGFRRAIVMLEDGCDEFSNVKGLTQIRFPKGRISSVFEEVRRVLEREKIIEG
ncbi:TIR domain-containing protein [Streptomyces mirabilis]|uniref:TIR domain-containing protein n=1 Tax=Streptomyces mirabilis TaxID=68239 RepID=UPI00369B940C